MKALYLLVFFFLSTGVFSQHNDIKGTVKSIREEVVYLDKESNKIKNADGQHRISLFQGIPMASLEFTTPGVSSNKFRKTWIEGPYSSLYQLQKRIQYKRFTNQRNLDITPIIVLFLRFGSMHTMKMMTRLIQNR